MFLRREERRNDRKRIEKSLIERKRDNLKIGLKIMGLKIVEKRKKKRIKIDVERIMRMIKIGKKRNDEEMQIGMEEMKILMKNEKEYEMKSNKKEEIEDLRESSDKEKEEEMNELREKDLIKRIERIVSIIGLDINIRMDNENDQIERKRILKNRKIKRIENIERKMEERKKKRKIERE